MARRSNVIIDRTFTELIIILLFTSFTVVIYYVQATTNKRENLEKIIFAGIDDQINKCGGKLAGIEENSAKTNSDNPTQAPYFKIKENSDFSSIPNETRSCVSQICGVALLSIYKKKELLDTVFIESYASPPYGRDGRKIVKSETGQNCSSTFECNVVLTSIRAANVYQICSQSIQSQGDKALFDWFQKSVFPIGKGVPRDSRRYRNIEFLINYKKNFSI